MENEIMDALRETVRAQQKGHKNDDIFTVGEQLLEIAEREPASAELLAKDLKVDGMGLSDAAKALREYADKNRKGARCFCITPAVADGILRKFYGLPEREEVQEPEVRAAATGRIDLSDFF